MILALSRFKVANGLEDSVAVAFRNKGIPRDLPLDPAFTQLSVMDLRCG